MLKLGLSKKSKIVLSDYNYRRDLDNRLLMARFSVLDVHVLEEILNNSLSFALSDLADAVDTDLRELKPTMELLSRIGLISCQGDVVFVDKEMRKYYEAQIKKFNNAFEPDMEFLQGLLRKVPIHVLPNWYAVSRTTNNIFDSLVEKYLLTPKIFRAHMLELNYEDAIFDGILEDVFASPDLKVLGQDLRRKYDLSEEDFEEYMLHLEFNFVCCLSYNLIDGAWQEVVTPFHEWREYMRFLRQATPKPIAGAVTPSSRRALPADPASALRSYRQAAVKSQPEGISSSLLNERNLRLIEVSLETVTSGQWVLFDDFLSGVFVAIGQTFPVALTKKGRRWSYALPAFTDEEKRLIRTAVLEWLANAAITEVGDYKGAAAFRLTPHGKAVLGFNN